METSDKIIMEELRRIILMQAQEITRLMKKIDVLESELIIINLKELYEMSRLNKKYPGSSKY
jgi:hypothetical protein